MGRSDPGWSWDSRFCCCFDSICDQEWLAEVAGKYLGTVLRGQILGQKKGVEHDYRFACPFGWGCSFS